MQVNLQQVIHFLMKGNKKIVIYEYIIIYYCYMIAVFN